MIGAGESRRNFFKKAAAAAGLAGVAVWLNKYLSAGAVSVDQINSKCANDLARQKKAWLRKQFVVMTDDDKRQMLDEILRLHNRDRA